MLDLRILDILELKLISVKMLPIFEHAASSSRRRLRSCPFTFYIPSVSKLDASCMLSQAWCLALCLGIGSRGGYHCLQQLLELIVETQREL